MSKKLAIRGHSTRGKEVIKLLEMMGGNNCFNLNGLFSEHAYYFIGGPHNDEIRAGEYIFGNEDMCFFTLEEFLKKYPYKLNELALCDDGLLGLITKMEWDCEKSDMKYYISFKIFDYNKWYSSKNIKCTFMEVKGKKLAIKGHPTRGNEVIELLEIMGGKNIHNLLGNDEKFIYYVIECNEIKGIPFMYDLEDYPGYIFLTLEEFLEKYPFKIGDKVKDEYGNLTTIKSMEWFNGCATMIYDLKDTSSVLTAETLKMYNTKNLFKHNNIQAPIKIRNTYLFNPHDIVVFESYDKKQKWICEYKSYVNNQLHFYKGTYDIYSNEEKYKKKIIYDSFYDVAPSDIIRIASSDERTLLRKMIEKDNTINPMKNVLAELLDHIKNTSKEELEKEFKEIKEWSNVGPTIEEFMEFCNKVNKKPKYKYPSTYEECKAVLQLQDSIIQARCGYEWRLISYFQQLLMCRDAYWKIAGEQMGLGKPWEPDWNDHNQPKFGIHNVQNNIRPITLHVLKNLILIFPTEEMRDVFLENFNYLIEACKELL